MKEANPSNQEENAADTTDIECSDRSAQSPSLARHVRATPDSNLTCNGDVSENIEAGCFFEIDHTKLPPRSPNQLKSICSVMVTEKTDLNITVRFPSILSLRKYFRKVSLSETGNLKGKVRPALDEQFVMGLKLARTVLRRRISSSEFAKQKHLQSFWLVPSKLTEISTFIREEGSGNDINVKGACWSALKCTELVPWGTRRRVTFIGRHNESNSKPSLVSPGEGKDDEKEAIKTEAQEIKKITRKREPECSSWVPKAKAARKHEKKKTSSTNRYQQKMRLSNGRWSAERYKVAEQKLLKIMKEKGAVFGHPMLRPALRLEARKHIGDTGLLDHLLKHLAGKVAPGGTERFRRRHNADGAMEYWLESADLLNIRKEAGVDDPYWTPPPGWKTGDSPSQDPVCAWELKLLKEEMTKIKRDVQELVSKKQKVDEGNVTEEANAAPKSSCDASELGPVTSVHVQEMYTSLLQRKAQIEQQLLQVSNSLNGMQEEMGKLTSSVKDAAKSAVVIEQESQAAAAAAKKEKKKKPEEEIQVAEEEEAVAEKAAKRRKLCSGFRICKPQGTFLWPNMGGSNMLSPQAQVVVQVEDLNLVPTPPSASSATSAPKLPIAAAAAPPPPPPLPYCTPFAGPASPVRPLAERPAVFASVSSVVSLESACQGDNISTTTKPLNLNDAGAFLAGEKEEGEAAVGTTMTRRAELIHFRSQHRGCSLSVGTWLALATPNPYLDDSNRS